MKLKNVHHLIEGNANLGIHFENSKKIEFESRTSALLKTFSIERLNSISLCFN